MSFSGIQTLQVPDSISSKNKAYIQATVGGAVGCTFTFEIEQVDASNSQIYFPPTCVDQFSENFVVGLHVTGGWTGTIKYTLSDVPSNYSLATIEFSLVLLMNSSLPKASLEPVSVVLSPANIEYLKGQLRLDPRLPHSDLEKKYFPTKIGTAKQLIFM